MYGLDRAGFFVKADDGQHYFPFGKEIDNESLRSEVIAVLHRSRAENDA